MALPLFSRPDFLQSDARDDSTGTATLCGICSGGAAFLLEEVASSRFVLVDQARMNLLILSFLSSSSGIVSTAVIQGLKPASALTPARCVRLGISAGFFCPAVGGGLLTFAASFGAINAKAAALDHTVRGQAWLVLAASVASLLPGVFCGFAGGLVGSCFGALKHGQKTLLLCSDPSPRTKWLQNTVAVIASLGLASPLYSLVKAPIVTEQFLALRQSRDLPALAGVGTRGRSSRHTVKSHGVAALADIECPRVAVIIFETAYRLPRPVAKVSTRELKV